jgi:hypothetical protein
VSDPRARKIEAYAVHECENDLTAWTSHMTRPRVRQVGVRHVFRGVSFAPPMRGLL